MAFFKDNQMDHTQIIYTSLQTYNHASTSPLSFYMPDALPATQPTVSKHWPCPFFIQLPQSNVKFRMSNLLKHTLNAKSWIDAYWIK